MEITLLALLTRKVMFKQLLLKVIAQWETELGIDMLFDSKACKMVECGHCLQPPGLANFLDFTVFGKWLNSCKSSSGK